jgi:type II secretory pathway pseudopilin PulG
VAWAVLATERRTLEKQALVDISRIEQAIRLFRADFGRCPENMDELVKPPERASYLQKKEDPWGQPYQVICPARFDPGGAEVMSGGPDRSFAGSDNISSL